MPELMALLEESARGAGRFVFLPSGTELPFADFFRRGEAVARYLNARVGTGGAVAAVLSNTPECVPNIVGVWQSGNTLVSLPHPSRGTTIERYQGQIETMLELSQARLLLVDRDYLPFIPQLSVPVVAYDEALTGGPRCDVTGSGDLIQFTSGSVGTPKGVRLSSEAVAANLLSLIEIIEPHHGDVPISWLPLSHDMGFIGLFLTSVVSLAPDIARGGTFPLMTPEHFLAQPVSWLQACSEFGGTITAAPNFAFELAVRTRSWHGALDLSPIRMVITGAERISAPTLTRFSDAFVDVGFNSQSLCPGYGMAEATLAVTMVRPKDQWTSLKVDREALGLGTVQTEGTGDVNEYVGNGQPMPGMEVRVVPQAGSEVGEVQVRGPSMLTGYVGADLQLTDDGWFPTRDLGFFADDQLYLVGRNDDTVIVGGRNFYAADIEDAVQHESLRQGCLAAVPLDEGGYALVAELKPDVAPEALETACRGLALNASRDFGVRPGLVAVVPRGQLPKTPSGKIQRPRIAQQLRTGDLETVASVSFGG